MKCFANLFEIVFTLNLGIHKDLEIRPQEMMKV